MSEFNLIDEPWIPVRLITGERTLMGIKDVLLTSRSIAVIEDASPLIVAGLHRVLLAVLYRALAGPASLDEAHDLLESGFPADRIESYLTKWHHRFWLFHDQYPFWQVPDFTPKSWKAWTALAAEHNGEESKVLFDHTNIGAAGAISSDSAARWLISAQTFSVGAGNSEFVYTKGAPSATGVMVIPQGRCLEETLIFLLVPQKREVTPIDIPVWERDPLLEAMLKNGLKRAVSGLADRYTWVTRSIILKREALGDVCFVGFASGVEFDSNDQMDPMLGYRTSDKLGIVPVQFREYGLWRDFDSLLPDASEVCPAVIEHAISLTRLRPARFPKSVLALGQLTKKAKVEFWRYQLFGLPRSLLSNRHIRGEIKSLLALSEDCSKSLLKSCRDFAQHILSKGDRKPDADDVSGFVRRMPCISLYWSEMERAFHELLFIYDANADPDVLRDIWVSHARDALLLAWRFHVDSMQSCDAWAIRAIAMAEKFVLVKIKELNDELNKPSVLEDVAS